jgi:hypothetical protein
MNNTISKMELTSITKKIAKIERELATASDYTSKLLATLELEYYQNELSKMKGGC